MRNVTLIKLALFFSFCFLLFSCSKKSDIKPQAAAPSIVSLNVNSGPLNTSVIITGTGFDAAKANDKVFFNGKAATVTAATTTQLTAIVPAGAGTGNVTVSVNSGTTVTGPVFTYQLSAVVTTIAGNNTKAIVDGQGTSASFSSLWGITIDNSGNIYVSDGNAAIRKVTSDGTVTTVAGSVQAKGQDIDGKGSAAAFSGAYAITTDAAGNVYIADVSKIRKMTPDGTVSTIYSGTSGLPDLTGIAIDATGNIYASDVSNNVIIKIKPDGTSAVLAGSRNNGGQSTDGTGTSAGFNTPMDIAIDGSGNIYVTDMGSNKIRKVTPDGVVTTVAGNGSIGSLDGTAANASFSGPVGISVSATGDLYINDSQNALVRKISSGMVSTIAGTSKITVTPVDGMGLTASFSILDCIKVDPASGNIYVADQNRIRKITFQ